MPRQGLARRRAGHGAFPKRRAATARALRDIADFATIGSMAPPTFQLALWSRTRQREVPASLTLDITATHLRQQVEQWRPLLGWYGGDRGDGDWDWSALIAEERNLAPRTTWLFAVETEGLLQGLMIAQKRRDLRANLGGGALLYVSYLAAAPWNRGNFRRAAYRRHAVPESLSGVGEALILAAVAMSRDLGMAGRVGLHSLEAALDFYVRNCHFTFVGRHARVQEGGTFWCELPSASAGFLERRARGR
ncbi:MAG: hypothetical protein K2X74_06705 [Acetobacteraceae bacterium]|nr:hypothetical protein [Acetobacteraceae bacterium]